MPLNKIYYVYVLFDQFGLPRYIGKGRGRRWLSHPSLKSGKNRIKNAFIKSTIDAIGEVPSVKLRDGLSEEEAFQMERSFISAIGRIDLRTGPLTNMSDGGTGGDFGHLIKMAKSQWTDEKRKQVSLNASKGTKSFWSKLSPEKQLEMTEFRIAKSISARKAFKSNPLWEKIRITNISKGHSKQTADQKKLSVDKQLISNPPERRSEVTKAWHASRSPEERSAAIKRGWSKLTPEQRSQRARGKNNSKRK